MVSDPYLCVDPDAVTASGGSLAGTSGGWQSWTRSVASSFEDLSGVVRNAVMWRAVDGYAVRWNPVAARLAGEVDALGATVVAAAVVVDRTDLDAAASLVRARPAVPGPAGGGRR
jgi:hypothetical protein